MDKSFIYTDGEKAVSLTGDEGWTYFSKSINTNEIEQYARVSAAFRAYNLKANTISNMPFVLYKGNEEFDNSATWENNIGFLPNPSELIRLAVLSLIATNTAYNLRTSDIFGRSTKGLYHAVSYSFLPYTNPVTGELDYIERSIGGTLERYTPDDRRLVRLWRLDHTTEVLPSPNTEARAIMNAAGQVYYADTWIQNFYRRGGVAPTVIMMKGMVFKGKQEDEENAWSNFFKGLGKWWNNVTRVANADALDIKQLGSTVADLKNNDVYRQALENIAMGTGIPLSLLLSNSANYATAQIEKKTWYENDIIPMCNWIGYEYNRQVFEPIGLRLEFKPETLDPQQEDETQRAGAISIFMDFLNKCPNAEIALETANTFGYELTDGLINAINKHFADKANRAKEIQDQTQRKPLVRVEREEPEEKPLPALPAPKWIPSLDQLKELKVWRDVALRKLKKAESLDFIYQSHYGGLPANVQNEIITHLPNAKTADEIKAIFDAAQTQNTETVTPPPVYESDIKTLAEALNRLADATYTQTAKL